MSSALEVPDLMQVLGQDRMHRNLHPARLVEAVLRRDEARLAARGSLVAETGSRTGRSPRDKFTVKDAITADTVDWGKVNVPFSPEKFDALYLRASNI